MPSINDLDRQLERHRNETIQAIQSGRTEVVSRRVNAYIRFMRAFVETQRELGIRYTPDQARKVTGLDWPLIRHFESNLYRIVEAAIHSIDMVGESLAALVRLLRLSIELKDYLIFHRVMSFYPALLRLSFTSRSTELRQFVLDRVWRHLAEFEEFYLVPSLTSEDHALSLAELRPYLDDIYDTFGDMLKVCIDSGYLEALVEVGRAFDRLGSRMSEGHADEELQQLHQELSRTRRVIWFGIGAWLSKLYQQSSVAQPIEPAGQSIGIHPTAIIEMFREVANRFNLLRELSIAYHQCLTQEPFMRSWEHWILQELPEREVHTIDFSRWLTLFYCLQGVRLTPIDITAATDTIPAQRTFKDKLNEIEATIGSIKQHRSAWESLTSPESLHDDRLNDFLLLVRKATERYQESKEDAIIEAHISDNKVQEFKKKVLNGLERYAWLRKLAVHFGTVETRRSTEVTTEERFGIRTLFPKEAFLEEPEAIYIGFGDDQGRSVGLGESSRVLKSWLETTGIETVQSGIDRVSEILESAAGSLRNRGYTPSVIVTYCSHDLASTLARQEGFIPEWHADCPRIDIQFFHGVFGELPVFFQLSDEMCCALVLDLKKFGTWVDYEITSEEPRTVEISVQEMSEEQVEKILDGKKEMNRRTVLQRVMVRVLELFEFRIQDPDAAVRIDFTTSDKSMNMEG